MSTLNLVELCITVLIESIDEKRESEFNLPDSLLQKLISRAVFCSKVNEKTLPLFLHSNLRTLKLSKASSFINDTCLKQISNVCTNLQSLSLYNCCNITEEALCELVSSSPQLKLLNLSKCPAAGPKVLMKVSEHCTQLETLTLNRNYRIDDELMSIILPKLPLKEFSVLGCWRLTENFLKFIPPSVTKLNISRNNISKEDALINLFNRCNKIRWIEFFKLKAVTDTVLEKMVENLADVLTHFHCNACEKLTEEGIVNNLLSKCKHIASLQLPFATDKIMKAISHFQSSSITSLSIPKACDITDDGFEAFEFPNLTEL